MTRKPTVRRARMAVAFVSPFGGRVGRRTSAIARNRILHRVLLVGILAAIGGAAGWLAVSGATPIYERTVSLIVVPDPKQGPTDVSSQIVTTIAGGIGSKRFLIQSAQKVLGHNPGDQWTLEAFVRPGSDIIDTRLRGPSVDALGRLANVYVHDSRAWTAEHYTAYDLTFLETTATPGRVSPHPKKTGALGFVLGGLLGILTLFIEIQLRQGRRLSWALREAVPAPEPEPVSRKPSVLREEAPGADEPDRTVVARRQRDRQRR